MLWIWPLYLHVNKKSDDDDDVYIGFGWRPFANFVEAIIFSHFGVLWFALNIIFSMRS